MRDTACGGLGVELHVEKMAGFWVGGQYAGRQEDPPSACCGIAAAKYTVTEEKVEMG